MFICLWSINLVSILSRGIAVSLSIGRSLADGRDLLVGTESLGGGIKERYKE